jgi:hypothetical protein
MRKVNVNHHDKQIVVPFVYVPESQVTQSLVAFSCNPALQLVHDPVCASHVGQLPDKTPDHKIKHTPTFEPGHVAHAPLTKYVPDGHSSQLPAAVRTFPVWHVKQDPSVLLHDVQKLVAFSKT